VNAPPAPALKDVTVNSKTTALLIMDFVKQTCDDKRTRCVADVLHIAKLGNEAPASGAPQCRERSAFNIRAKVTISEH
jgi:hypothetical protein